MLVFISTDFTKSNINMKGAILGICSNHFFGPGAKQSDETRGRGGRGEEEVAKPLQQPRRKIRYAPL